MSNPYWITFRVGMEGDDIVRRDALRLAVLKLTTKDSRWWTEPTSFYAFMSEASIDEIASAVNDVLEPATDVALIGRVGFKTYRVIGGEDDDVFSIFPEATRYEG